MPRLTITRRRGRLSLVVRGCCGDLRGTRREYDRALARQLLHAGGRLTGWDAQRFEITDRRGRVHTFGPV